MESLTCFGEGETFVSVSLLHTSSQKKNKERTKQNSVYTLYFNLNVKLW